MKPSTAFVDPADNGNQVARGQAPDRITFDLDPGENVAWTALIDGANEVRELRVRSES